MATATKMSTPTSHQGTAVDMRRERRRRSALLRRRRFIISAVLQYLQVSAPGNYSGVLSHMLFPFAKRTRLRCISCFSHRNMAKSLAELAYSLATEASGLLVCEPSRPWPVPSLLRLSLIACTMDLTIFSSYGPTSSVCITALQSSDILALFVGDCPFSFKIVLKTDSRVSFAVPITWAVSPLSKARSWRSKCSWTPLGQEVNTICTGTFIRRRAAISLHS